MSRTFLSIDPTDSFIWCVTGNTEVGEFLGDCEEGESLPPGLKPHAIP